MHYRKALEKRLLQRCSNGVVSLHGSVQCSPHCGLCLVQCAVSSAVCCAKYVVCCKDLFSELFSVPDT